MKLKETAETGAPTRRGKRQAIYYVSRNKNTLNSGVDLAGVFNVLPSFNLLWQSGTLNNSRRGKQTEKTRGETFSHQTYRDVASEIIATYLDAHYMFLFFLSIYIS